MIKGVDISKWQGQVNFDQLKNDVQFVVIRSSYSNNGPDEQLVRNRDEARRVGLPRWFYHYSYPDRGNSAESEAEWFVKQVGPLQNGEGLVLDFEQPYGDPVTWSLAFCKRVEALTGVKPVLYVNESTALRYNWQPLVDNNNGLWVASWGSNDGNVPARQPSSGRWAFWAMWQYTSNGSVAGVSGRVDCNQFHGDVAQFQKYGKAGATPAPAPTAPPVPAPKPVAPGPSGTYTVQAGDSLSGIAGKYGMDWRVLYGLNKDVIGGDPNKIFPGQVLRTTGVPATVENYTVVSGDTLSGIAGKVGSTWRRLYDLNRDKISDPNVIFPGQILRVK